MALRKVGKYYWLDIRIKGKRIQKLTGIPFRLPYTDLKKSFKKACSSVGITDLRFHDLRHTFATRLLASGVDIVTVRDLLGHFSVRITQRYTHSNQEQKREAVQRLAGKALKQSQNLENLVHIGTRELSL